MRRVWVACAAAVFVMLSGGVALADEPGSLLVVPDTGTIDSPIDVVTSGLCVRGVTFVVAVRGDGIDPVTSGNAVGNTELAILEPAVYPGHHAVPLSRTLREFFTTNGVGAPTGEYDLVFACRDRLDASDLQTFTAAIRIDEDGAYRAVGAAAKSLEDFIDETPGAASAGPAPSGSASSDATAGEGSGDSGSATEDVPADEAEESAVSAEPESAAAAPEAGGVDTSPTVTEATAATAAPVEDNTWRTVLIGFGIVLLGGAAYLGRRSRTR